MRFVFRIQKNQDVRDEILAGKGHWTFLGLGDEKKWYGKSKYLSEGKKNSVVSPSL